MYVQKYPIFKNFFFIIRSIFSSFFKKPVFLHYFLNFGISRLFLCISSGPFFKTTLSFFYPFAAELKILLLLALRKPHVVFLKYNFYSKSSHVFKTKAPPSVDGKVVMRYMIDLHRARSKYFQRELAKNSNFKYLKHFEFFFVAE